MSSVIGFLITISVLVLIHEWGHYIVARLLGVKILAFSLGFGKVLFKKKDKNNCEWRLAALPVGGYVKMFSTEELDDYKAQGIAYSEADFAHAFDRQSVYKRFLIVLAGPLMNLILAVVLYSSIAMTGIGVPANRIDVLPNSMAEAAHIERGDRIVAVNGTATPDFLVLSETLTKETRPYFEMTLEGEKGTKRIDFSRSDLTDPATGQLSLTHTGIVAYVANVMIGRIEAGRPAEGAGIAPGDTLISANGTPIKTGQQFIEIIRASNGKAIEIELETKFAEKRTVYVKPDLNTVKGQSVWQIGATIVSLPETVSHRFGPLDSFEIGARNVWHFISMTLSSLTQMILGNESLQSLSGPIAIGQMAGQTLSSGLTSFLSFLAIISVSLGVINLIPIPVLDGGHLAVFTYEIIARRQPSPKVMRLLQNFGLIVLLTLSVFTILNDLLGIFGVH